MQYYDSRVHNFRYYLSKNPNITLQMVLEDIKRNPFKRKEWDPNNLAYYIPVKDLLAHGFLFDRIKEVSIYGHLDIDTVLQNEDIPWDWRCLTWNKRFTMDDIAAHPEIPWEYEDIHNNPNFKMHTVVLEHETEHTFSTLSLQATPELIKQYPDKPWTFACLGSSNIKDKQLLYELYDRFYKENSHLAINSICRNPNMSFQELYELCGTHPNFFTYISFYPNLTFEDFLKYPDANWCILSHNLTQKIPFEYLLEHPELKWCWRDILLYNKNISIEKLTDAVFDEIDGHRLKNEAPRRLNYNRTFMYKYTILKNSHVSYHDKKVIYEDLLNKMNVNHYMEVISYPFFLEPTFEEMREYFAGRRIVRYVVQAVSNPEYEQCRKRLKREHEKMKSD